MKTGRNDPCPCGSGKKYKKCCLIKEQPKVEDLFWHRLHSARNGLISKILKFANQTYGDVAVHEAWDEFHLFKGSSFDPESHQMQIFMPWFFYFWTPYPEETKVKETAPFHSSPAAEFLGKKGKYLDVLERDYVEACLKSPFSFFEVIECDPGKGYKLKDLFTKKFFDVVEKSGSKNARVGDMLFAQPVTVEGLTTLEACSPILIPPIHKCRIIDLRKHIQTQHNPILPEDLFYYDIELIELYHHFHDVLLNPKMPQLCNTDGDSLVPHKLIYEIDSPKDVFHALKDLNFAETEDSLLKNAKFDKAGNFSEIEFSWLKKGNKKHKTWNNTILGHINIDKTNLLVDVNSEKRAKKFQSELKKRIKEGIRYKTTVIESIKAAIDKSQQEPKKPSRTSKEQEDLMNHPELKAHLEKMMEDHWKNWVNEKIPVLNNMTPVEASRTEDGREMLDALLTQFERDSLDNPQPGTNQETFKKIRQQLGLEYEKSS